MTRKSGNCPVTEGVDGMQKRVASVQNSRVEIWSSMLDGRYTVAVHRIGPYRGELTIRDGTRLMYRQQVSLASASVFGPGSVSKWQRTTITVVRDSQYLPQIPSEVRWTGGPIA